MKKIKFSIITPCLNRVHYLRETIESVLNQTVFKNNLCEMQYIIIDGGSDDGSLELIKEYNKIHQNIEYISEKDEGMYDALTKGFEKCTGDIISYINAGDFYNLNAFEIIENILNNSHNIDWVTGGKYIYNEKSQITKSVIPYNYRRRLIQAGVYGRFLPYIQQESTFWRIKLNKLIDNNKLKEFKLAGDYYIWSTFAAENKLHIIQTHLGGFKVHGDQLSKKTLSGNLTYKKEVAAFTNRIGVLDVILILLDFIPWALLRYSNDFFGNLSNHIRYDDIKKEFTNKEDNHDVIYCWSCDFATNRGEGKLAHKFLLEKYPNSSSYIHMLNRKLYYKNNLLNNDKLTESKINLDFIDSYVVPIIGILWLWWKFLNRKKICYLNFLPLWNSLLIIFLPPGTILGPITGSIHVGKANSIQGYLRKYLLPILYTVNAKIIVLRSRKLIFATHLLKKYFKGKTLNESTFGYILDHLIYKKYNKSKKIDIVIYYRDYDTKSNLFFKELIKYFSNNEEFNFLYFGNQCENFTKDYLGFIESHKVIEILDNAKFAPLSEENFESFFTSECLSNHVNIFYNSLKMSKPTKFDHSKKIIDIDYDNVDESLNTMKKYIRQFDELNIPYDNKTSVN